MINLGMGAAWPLNDLEPETGTPHEVRFTCDHLSLRLANGILHLLPLLLNPGKTLDDRKPYPLFVEPLWCRYADTARWRVDADVQVLDLLVDDLDVNPTDSQSCTSDTHPWPL